MEDKQQLISRGSYTNQSFLSLNNEEKKSTSLLQSLYKGNAHSPFKNSPRTSYSQLRLQQLTEGKFQEMESYGLEELRDGFFDPSFTIYERPVVDAGEIIPSKQMFSHSIREIPAGLKLRWRNLIKFTLPYFIALVLCVEPTIGKWLGPQRVFMPLAVVIHHSVHSIGVQLEITIQSLIGGAIGVGWSALALYISTATQPTRNHQGGILAGSLVICCFFTTWIRTMYIRLFYLFLSMGIPVLFTSTSHLITSRHGSIDWKVLWDFAIPYIFGLCLSLLGSFIIFPDFGHRNVVRTVSHSFQDMRNLLASYKNDTDTVQLQRQLHVVTVELSEAFREFSNHLKLTRFSESDLKGVRNAIAYTISPLRALPEAHSLFDEGSMEVMPKVFGESISGLIDEMINVLETAVSALYDDVKVSDDVLNSRIINLDTTYKRYIKSFNKEQLQEHTVNDMFLFLRYTRQSAIHLQSLTEAVNKLHINSHWRVILPNYPWSRALTRLSRQCLRDQGAGSVFNYFNTKRDVDDAFEKIYHVNTSRVNNPTGNARTVRAIDHNDFNFHSTNSPWRYSLWRLSTKIVGMESKYAFKIMFITLLLSIPAWLVESHYWYDRYFVFWSPIVFYILINARNSSSWYSLIKRVGITLIGCFWAWAANQAGHSSPYVVVTFGTVLAVVLSYNHLVNGNAKSSSSGLIAFTIIAMEIYSRRPHSSAGAIWKNTWIASLGILSATFLSIPVNWILWPFVARDELRKAMSSLLSHISASYQTVADRYLYRDENDDPTDLTLQLASIREVRMAQSIVAVKELLYRAELEPNYIHTFKSNVYIRLIDSCEIMLGKITEARMSGSYFHATQDDPTIARALMSLRRDSVAAVIFVLYVVGNSFLTENKIPKYLPSPIMSRKKLYDFINHFENSTPLVEEEDDLKSHWTEIHGLAFARAFTDITEQLHHIVDYAKEIIGEEEI